MSPSEIEEILFAEPFKPFRVTLASGDQLVIESEDRPFVSGLALILRGDREGGRVTSGSRLVSIPNITLLEPAESRPGGRRRRSR